MAVVIDNEAFTNEFIKHYYQIRCRSKLIETLKHTVRYQLSEENADRLLYFFTRAAILEPEVLQDYQKIRHIFLVGREQRFIQAIIKIAMGESVSELSLPLDPKFPLSFDVLNRSVTRPIDLDYLWIEFFLTGNTVVVEKIIDVIRGADFLRAKLNKWLSEPCVNLLQKRKKHKVITALDKKVGIVIDELTDTISTKQDLDCLAVLGRGIHWPTSSKRFQRIMSLLPFKLSQRDINHIMIKSAARWSLVANAMDNVDVKAIYHFQEESLPTRVRFSADEFDANKVQVYIDNSHINFECSQVSKKTLEDSYRSFSTDYLLELHQEQLTELAYETIENELSKRGVSIPRRPIFVHMDEVDEEGYFRQIFKLLFGFLAGLLAYDIIIFFIILLLLFFYIMFNNFKDFIGGWIN